MKNIKTYLILLLTSSTSVSYGVTLPSHPFFGANELYAENEDVVEISEGTRIGGINMRLQTNNEEWGTSCSKGGTAEQGECQDCCDASWAATNYADADEVLYDTCIKMCGGGPSLPLGSALWLLPFAFAYAGIKSRKSKRIENFTQSSSQQSLLN